MHLLLQHTGVYGSLDLSLYTRGVLLKKDQEQFSEKLCGMRMLMDIYGTICFLDCGEMPLFRLAASLFWFLVLAFGISPSLTLKICMLQYIHH